MDRTSIADRTEYLLIAKLARFYDGKTAEPHEASARPTADELVIYRPADQAVLAHGP